MSWAGAPFPVVLWDLDNTLVRLGIRLEDVRSWKARLAERLREAVGWTAPLSPVLPSLEAALREARERLGEPAAGALRREIYESLDRWEASTLGTIEVVLPAAAAFKRWRSQGVPSAIVTNNGQRALAAALQALGRGGWLEAPVVAVARGPDRAAKPDPAPLEAALDDLGFGDADDPVAVVVIGDGESDWQAARALATCRAGDVWALRPDEDSLAWAPAGPTPDEPAPAWLRTRWGLTWGDA